MAAPSTFVRVRLNTIADSRLPFPAQLVLGLAMLAYALTFVLTSQQPDTEHEFRFLHFVFLGVALSYLGYVLFHSAPLFGTQSYLELTPDYLVHKRGLFRPKAAFQAEEIARLELSPKLLTIVPKEGEAHHVSLRQVRGKRRKERLRQGIEAFAGRHTIPLALG